MASFGEVTPVSEKLRRTWSGSGALPTPRGEPRFGVDRPPPPVVAPLVPRFALIPAATPRLTAGGLAVVLHGVCPWRWAGTSFSLDGECPWPCETRSSRSGRSHAEEAVATCSRSAAA